ncbi:MAG: hypothetical protein SPI12_06515 [Actinomycetaceae bacterium]|nr:hypothetical protein [Actinomycetaceae bacterium]MDY6083491.1 hypothetical protein [Actinomycetaceae bacterium]
MKLTHSETFEGSRLKIARALLSKQFMDKRAQRAGFEDMTYIDEEHSSSIKAVIPAQNISALPPEAIALLPDRVPFTLIFDVAEHTENHTTINIRLEAPELELQFTGVAHLHDVASPNPMSDTMSESVADDSREFIAPDQSEYTKGAGVGMANGRTQVDTSFDFSAHGDLAHTTIEDTVADHANALFSADANLLRELLTKKTQE